MAVNQFGDPIEEGSAPATATTTFGDPVQVGPAAPAVAAAPAAPAIPVETTSFGDPLITETPAPAVPGDRYADLAAGNSPFAPATPEPSTFAAPTLESSLQGVNDGGGFAAYLSPLDPLQVSGLAQPMNGGNILASMGKPDVWQFADERRKRRDALVSEVGDDVLADLLIDRARVTRKIEQLPNEKGEAGGLGAIDPKALHDLTVEQGKLDAQIREREATRPTADKRRADALAEAQAKLSPNSPVKLSMDGGLTLLTGSGAPSSEDLAVAKEFDEKLRSIKAMESPSEARAARIKELAGGAPTTALSQFIGAVSEQISGVTGLTKRVFGVSRTPGDFESSMSETGVDFKDVAAAGSGALAPVGRGVGTVAGLMAGGPSGNLGMFVGALRAGSEAYSETLEKTHDESKALKAAGETVPGMLLFMGVGKVAGGFASSLAGESTVAMKTLSSFTGATLANVGSSAVLRALGAEPGKGAEAATPTIETLTADTLFAVFHAHGDYEKASKEAKVKAMVELRRRGFTQEQINAASEEPPGKAPADAVIPEDPAVAEANRAEAARKQAALDSAAKSAEIAGMPLTSEALKAESARQRAPASPPSSPEPKPEPPKPVATRPVRPPLTGPIAEIHRPEVDLIARLRSPYESPEPKQIAPQPDPAAAPEPAKSETPGKPAVPNEETGAAPQGEVPTVSSVQPERAAEESAARDLTPAEQSEIDAELEREHREAEEEWRREQEAHRAEMEGEISGGLGANELLDVLRRLGGLPSLDRDTSLTGETRRLWETNKGHMMRLVSRSQTLSLDQVRQDLEQFGFKYETPDEMLAAIESRLVSGKEQYAFEHGGDFFASRRDTGTMDLFGYDPAAPAARTEQPAPAKRIGRAPKSTLEEDRAAVVQAKRAALGKAWTELVAADPWKFPAVAISDLARRAGMTLTETKDLLTQLHKEGKIVLSIGDWSLSSEAKRAGAIEIGGQRYLQVRPIGETVFESKTPPPSEPSPVSEFRARLLDAAGKAKPEAEWDATGKTPPTVDFERPDRPGAKVTLLNTREALTAAAERYRPETSGTHLTRVAEVIENAKQAVSGVHVVVVRNEGDLPARVRARLDPRAVHEGLANPGTQTVYIFAGNISTPARALEVFAHEVVGHLGVERIMKPAEWTDLVDSIITRNSPLLDDIARKYTHATDGRELTPEERSGVVAREYIARLAEKPSANPTAWEKVVAAVRRGLRSLGIVKEWSEGDIRDLLRRAATVVESRPGERIIGEDGKMRAAVRDLGKEVETHSPYASEVERAYHEAVPGEDSRAAVDAYVKGRLAGDEELPPLSPEEKATAEKFLRYFADKQSFADRNGVGDTVRAAMEARLEATPNLDLPERLAVFSAEVNKAAAGRTEPPAPGAGEPVAAGGEKGPTSIKNAVVDKERAARGLPPAIEPARRSFGRVWDDAMGMIDRDSTVQDRLIAELENSPRAVEDWEDALLLHRQIELQNSYDRAAADFVSARDASDHFAADSAKARAEALSEKLLQVYGVGKSAGTATARGLNARKMLANEDFTLAKMVTEKRVANDGEPLTPEQQAEVVELHQTIADLQRQIAEHETAKAEKASDAAAADAMKAMVEQVDRENKSKSKPAKEKPSTSAKVIEALSAKANEARARIRARAGTLNIGLNPAELLDYAIIGAEYFAKGAVSIGRFGAKLVLEFGDAVRPHIPEIFAKARQMAEEAKSERDLPAERTAIVDGIKQRVGEGDTLQDLGSYVRKLSLNLVRAGVSEREALIDAVHQDLQAIDPAITRRQAMDLISGYGEFKPLDQEAAKVQLRDLKGQMQQIGKLEDMAGGKAPRKTGVQQREKSDTERKLVKEVNEAKKKGGFEVTDPATQLRSALAARERALTNEIKAVQEEIATGVRRNAPSAPPTSPEVEALKVRLADLRAEREKIFGKPELTDEQRLKIAIDAANRSTAEYERQVRESDFAGKAGSKLTSPELEAAKARRDAARAHRDELRALDVGIRQAKEDARTKQLQASIDELDRKLRTGDTDPVSRKPPLLTPAQEALVAERDAMLKLLSQIRRNPKSDAVKQVERLTKQIDDLDQRLASGNIASKGKPASPPLSPEAARLMKERDARVKALQALRDAAKPRLSKEEIALKRWKSATTNRIAELADRAAKGQWDTPPRMPMTLDPAGQKLAFDLETAKEKFNRGRFEDMLRRRSLGRKILGGVGEVVNTARAVMTAFDLSAVLRQGGFIVLARPGRALRAFPAMFRAFGSERGAHAVEAEIASRPNADLYRQAKLDLSKRGTSLSHMEEAYMSRWAEKIPLVAGSERAYRTFLNRLRADSFDAMAKSFTRRGTPNLKEAQALANFINVATGRGRLGPKMATAAVGLNHVFFAPRLVLSRFQLLTGQPLWGGSMATRRAIAGEYARYLVGVGVVLALAQAAGSDKLETDPRSSDFGKLKFGHTRIDPFSGLLQSTVVASRVLGGSTKTARGAIVKLRTAPGEKRAFGQDDAGDVIGRFLRSKLSPVAGAAMDIASGRNVVGEPITPGMAATRMFVPLTFTDVYDAMKAQGAPAGVALSILTIFGAGVQTYDEKAKKK